MGVAGGLTRRTGRVATRTGRMGFRMVLATVLGAVFGWWWDRPALVRDKAVEHPLEKRAQVSSAVFWPIFAVWLAAEAPRCPEWVASLASALGGSALPLWAWSVLASGFATVVLMRRIMASAGHGWGLSALVRSSKRWLNHHTSLTVVLLAGCVALPLYWVTGDRGEASHGHGIPTVTLLAVGALIAMREVSWRRKEASLRPRLAQVHKVTEAVLENAVLMPRKGGGLVMTHVPPAVVANLEGAGTRMAVQMPEYEMRPNKNEVGAVTSITYLPTGEEELAMRDVLATTGGLVSALTPAADPKPWRPDEHVATWGEKVSATMAAQLDASLETLGFTVVEWDPGHRTAHVARLDDETRTVRARLANLLGTEPHAVEVELSYAHDEKLERERLDVVTVHRAPNRGTNLDKRTDVWRDLVVSLPDGSNGWKVSEDPATGVVTLTYGQPRVLPDLVPMAKMLPPALDTSNWSRLALGLDPDGNDASIDLTAGPHALIVGPTGSGKSVLLRQHAVSALAHGHRLIVIDAVKGGLDFLAFKPWCVAFGESLDEARIIIEKVYAEGQRRKALLKAYEAPSWVDLPAAVRRKENIYPLTMLFDEFMSAAIASPVPKGLDKDDPLVQEANRLNADKAVILAMIGKIARELRFSGIFAAIAMQRPDAAALPGFGEIRSNLTSAVQLIKPGSLPAQETLRMVFPGDQTHVATETIMELDDGSSKGLALIGADGGDVTGFRVAFGVPSEIPAFLEDLGVPKPERWTIEPPESDPEPWTPIQPTTPSPAPVPAVPTVEDVVDLGVVELSLDDLEDAAPAEPSSPGLSDFDDDDFAPVRTPRHVEDDDEFTSPPKPKVAVDLTDLW